MKILRFNDNRIGALKNNEQVVDISDIISYRIEKGPQRAMEELIEGFDAYLPEIEKLVALEPGIPLPNVRLLAPIPRPGKCICAYVNFLEDTAAVNPEENPIEFFYKNPDLLPPEGTIELLDIPPVTVFEPEAELAYIIGKRAKNVKPEDAMDYVFGFVPFFDVSARGLKRATQFLAKGQDTYSPCGPWITTKDEIPNPHELKVSSWLNGAIRQNYSAKGMIHKIPKQISWLTRFVQLHPGDLIAAGTTREGLGAINDGDVLEIEIERLGKARFFVKGHGPRKDVKRELKSRVLHLDITPV